MLALANLALAALASSSALGASAAPAASSGPRPGVLRRAGEGSVTGGTGHGLNCVTYLYGPPFTSSSPRTAKATSPLSAYQSSTNETTPLHISAGTGGRLIRYDAEEDGPTGEFGFDVCESDDGFAYDGVKNSAQSVFGHLIWIDLNGKQSCVTVPEPYDGQIPVAGECVYTDSVEAQKNQMFNMNFNLDGEAVLYFRAPDDFTYGPDPDATDGQPLTLDNTNVTDLAYFKFSA